MIQVCPTHSLTPAEGIVDVAHEEDQVVGNRTQDGAPVELSTLPYTVARLTDADGAAALRDIRGVEVLSRTDGTLLALFPNAFWLEQARKQRPEAMLVSLASAG
ncbi:MAG TPA: hypothetical protein VMR89_12680 [Actinomycetota bacterium]|nr:hypothetical protein [Actinomycetota bacterium]